MSREHIELIFSQTLRPLLPRGKQLRRSLIPLTRKASIKDIIESLGVPHCEIGSIKLSPSLSPISFHYIPQPGDVLEVTGFSPSTPIFAPTVLRPQPLTRLAFMIDTTILRLGRKLRMAGFDTHLAPATSLPEIGSLATAQSRILVSRNRDLLKCATVTFGQLIRSSDHRQQLHEIRTRFRPEDKQRPFSRCTACNGLLQEVAKATILDLLEPLTKKYYNSFKQCPDCGKIYWEGSHVERMRAHFDLW
jgi:uncharacterized protein with PIN domain